ncbi:MAG TPA: OmpA family protein [Pirellulales bacterium]|jgi:chemotaxis protein MotB|nr:OmpA family protein [Pirellulales bacterium]
MRAALAGFCLLSLCAAGGCATNSLALQGQVTQLQDQQAVLTQRNQELQGRAATLDHDNQELESMLAQSRQQGKILEDQLAATRDQLGGATSQLARLKMDYDDTSRKAETLEASAKRRVGATITARSSLDQQLPAITIPGVMVRADGDVVRIELPGTIFEQGSARLLPQAGGLVDQVAAEVLRAYPNQIIGVEGHTDSDPVRSNNWSSNHQLSIGRAMAVYDHLVGRSHVYPGQLFVVGHGANHPVVSNGTAAGKQRNRRVELVVYPDRVPGR